jgi:hypothetical protein
MQFKNTLATAFSGRMRRAHATQILQQPAALWPDCRVSMVHSVLILRRLQNSIPSEDPQMLNYEIRYLTSDDRVAIIYKTLLSGDRDAVLAASKPTRLIYKHYEVWRGDECVGRGINPRLPN